MDQEICAKLKWIDMRSYSIAKTVIGAFYDILFDTYLFALNFPPEDSKTKEVSLSSLDFITSPSNEITISEKSTYIVYKAVTLKIPSSKFVEKALSSNWDSLDPDTVQECIKKATALHILCRASIRSGVRDDFPVISL